MLDSLSQKFLLPILSRVVAPLARTRIRPGAVTQSGAACGVLSGVLFFAGFRVVAAALIVLSGLLDLIDGPLARAKGADSPRGGFLDLFCDRLVEVAVVSFYALTFPDIRMAAVALLGATLLSITIFLSAAAVAANNGPRSIHYLPGLMERGETIIFFALFYLLPDLRNIWVPLFAALIGLTVVQRFIESWRLLPSCKK